MALDDGIDVVSVDISVFNPSLSAFKKENNLFLLNKLIFKPNSI